MWGLSDIPTDDDDAINAYKIAQGITNPCAGIEGGAEEAIDVVIEGQNFLGYPTYIVICSDKSMYFDVCWPPSSSSCFDPYFEDCADLAFAANFSSDFTDVCQYETVTYEDLSMGEVTSWNWTFEGGDPATSTDQNPSVTYNESGAFDVELEVSNGSNTNTLTIENYINVEVITMADLSPFDDACDNDPAFELTGGTPEGGVYSGPGVGSGWFDPATAGIGLHTIVYTYTGTNGCESIAEQTILVDACTGIDNTNDQRYQVYPNPTNGVFEVKIQHDGLISIQVYNMLGTRVYQEEYLNNGSILRKIDISELENGIYFVSIKTEDETFVKKLNLINQ